MNENNDNAKEITPFHEEYTNLMSKDIQFLSKKHNMNEIITDDFEKDLDISGIGNNTNEEINHTNSKNSKIRKDTLTNHSYSKDFSEDLNDDEISSRKISVNSLKIDEISQITNQNNKFEIKKTSTKKITKEDLDNIPIPVFSCIYCSNETVSFKHFSQEILENKYLFQTSIYDIQELNKLIMYQPLIDKYDKNEKLLDIVIKYSDYINKYYPISEINNYFKSDIFGKLCYKFCEDSQKNYINKIEECITKIKKDSYFKGINIISKNSYNNKCLFNSTNSLINNYNALSGFVEVPIQINNNNNINTVKNSYNNTVGASCSNTSLNFNSLSLNINNNEIGCLCKDNNILDNIVENIEKNSQSAGDADDKDEIIMDFFGFNTGKKINKDQIIWENEPYDIWNPVINDKDLYLLNEDYNELSHPHLKHDLKIDNEDNYEISSNYNNVIVTTISKRKKNNVIKNRTNINFKNSIKLKDEKQGKLKMNLSNKNNNIKFNKNKSLFKKDNSISLIAADNNNQKQSFSYLKSICSSTNNSSNMNLNFMNKTSKSRSKITTKSNEFQKTSLQYINLMDNNIQSNIINNNNNYTSEINKTKSFYSTSIANKSISLNSNKVIRGNSIKLQRFIKYPKNNSTSMNFYVNGSISKICNNNKKNSCNKSKNSIKPKENKKTIEKTKSSKKISRKKNNLFTATPTYNFNANFINNFNKSSYSNINLTSSNKRINSGIITNILKNKSNKIFTPATINKDCINVQNSKSGNVPLVSSSLNIHNNNSPKKYKNYTNKSINFNNHKTIGEFRKNTLTKTSKKKSNLTGQKSKIDINAIYLSLEKDISENRNKNKINKTNNKSISSKNCNKNNNKKTLTISNSYIVKDKIATDKKNNYNRSKYIDYNNKKFTCFNYK